MSATEIVVSFEPDDLIGGLVQLPYNTRVYWAVEPNGEQWIRTEREVDHARGKRCVATYVPMEMLLDAIASTRVGRKALLDALARHES